MPARRLRSWRPPVMTGARLTPRRSQSAPTPFGPPNLWAASESRSTPSAPTSIGILPAAWTASVWQRAPRARARRENSATGLHHARLVVRQHHRHERHVLVCQGVHGAGLDRASRCRGERGHRAPGARQGRRGVRHRLVLDRRDDEPAARGGGGADDPADRHVVRLGAAGREDDVAGLRPDQPRHLGPGLVDGRLGALAEAVDARGIAELLAQARASSRPRPPGQAAWWRCDRGRCAVSSGLRTVDDHTIPGAGQPQRYCGATARVSDWYGWR